MSSRLRRVKDRRLAQWALVFLAGGWLVVPVTTCTTPDDDPPASANTTRQSDSADTAAQRRRSIAVLPFTNTNEDGDQDYFGDGMTESLLDALADVDGLRVASSASSFALKGRDIPLREVGTKLNVATVLEGSVRRAGGQIQVTARLTHVREDSAVWSNSYTRELADVFEVQEEIAREVVSALRPRPLDDAERIVDPPTDDIVAYDAYLRGRHLLHRRTRESLPAARDAFRVAVQRAPGFAKAHLGLADAYVALGLHDRLPAAEAFPAASSAARTALGLDPSLAEAHATLGYVALYYERDWELAERELRTAVEVKPRHPVAHQWLATYLVAMGRFDEAAGSMRRAVELDPLSRIASATLGWVHYHAGNYEAALDQYRRTLELDPDFHLAHLWNGLALLETDQPRAALRSIRRALQLAPEDPLVIATLALAQARAGEGDDAERMLEWLRARQDRHHAPAYAIAKVHLAMGDAPRALEWLERAFDQRSHAIVFLAVDPQLAPLLNDPAFARLVSRAGLVTARAGAARDPRRR